MTCCLINITFHVFFFSPTLYRGIIPVLESLCASNFVYFYTFHGLKAMKDKSSEQSAVKDLLLASVAGNCLKLSLLSVVCLLKYLFSYVAQVLQSLYCFRDHQCTVYDTSLGSQYSFEDEGNPVEPKCRACTKPRTSAI
jgi:hypothetical protein